MRYQRIMTVDGASRTGWAIGDAGARPQDLRHGAEQIKRPNDHLLLAAHRAHRWIDTIWGVQSNIPELVVIEEPSLRTERTQTDKKTGARFQINTGARIPVLLCGFAMGIVNACEWQEPKIPWEVVPPQTWQKDILGAGKRPSGDELKRAVRHRLQAMGYFPRNLADSDRSDAVGIWVYAEAKFGRRAPPQLFMKGEEAFL